MCVSGEIRLKKHGRGAGARVIASLDGRSRKGMIRRRKSEELVFLSPPLRFILESMKQTWRDLACGV